MKIIVILAVLVLLMSIMTPVPTKADLFGDMLAKTELEVCHARSFHGNQSATAFAGKYPIKQWEKSSINLDALAFPGGIDDNRLISFGGGFSFAVGKAGEDGKPASRLSLGVGYLPEGMDWSGYLTFKIF